MKKIIYFNLIAIIIIFLSAEFFLRFFNIITLQGFEKNSFYKEANVTYHYPNILKTIMGKKIKTDKNGFRIPINEFNYNDKLKNILILGDSVSFGVGVEEKNTFIGILRKSSKKNLYNSSVAGHRLQNYSFLIKKYHNQLPEINEVLIFLCLNDIVAQDGILMKERLKFKSKNKNFFYKIRTNKLFIDLNFFLREKSTVFNLSKAIGTQNVKRHFNYIKPYYESKNFLDEYERNIKKIVNYSNFNKINVNFILLPYKYQIKKNCVSSIMNPQNQINSIFRKLDYKLYDFTQEFCNKYNKKKLFLNFDPMHLSTSGHKYVSQLLKKKGIVN